MIGVGLAMAAAVLGWIILWRRSRFAWDRTAGRPEARGAGGHMRTVRFPAIDGTMLEAWLFLPDAVAAPPVAVMAPGLGGTKDGLIEPFAWAFVAHGIAALLFDYRGFGGSDGLPRHWVAPPRHREDYEAAMAFIRRDLNGIVDGARIALWGSSFSGGVALVTAARQDDVCAVVAQCPFLKTPPHLEPRGLTKARYVFLAALDMLRLFPPIYIPLFGRPGERVFAPSTENPSVSDFGGPLGADFWRRLPQPPLGGWENRMLARGLATLDEAIPMDALGSISCPVLLVAARDDDMVPLSFVEEAHARLSHGSEFMVCDCGHFDLYVGTASAENIAHQADFLACVLVTDTRALPAP